MPDEIKNLWPTDFRVNVQTPFAILSVQANLLGKMTHGVLTGSVETEKGDGGVQHRLIVMAPAFNSYRINLLTATHGKDLPFPVRIIADALATKVERRGNESFIEKAIGVKSYETVYPTAADDDEMQRLVGIALRSDQVKAIILSLIARSNEANLQDEIAESPQSNPNSPPPSEPSA